ncbi:hypothetical protein BH10PSE19_BH10PSE19_01140 [soil metagenome]
MYGMGSNEQLLGKTLKLFRAEIVLATKFGIIRDPQNSQVRGVNGHPAYVKTACDASLKRLDVDVIDLYYLHRIDPNVPIEETVGAMADLIHAGKVRYLGLSEANANTIKKANKVHPISAIQSEYSLWTRDAEKEIIPLCEQLNISFIPYSPLGRGFLTNMLDTSQLHQDDFRRLLPRLRGINLEKNQQLINKFSQIALIKKCTSAQLALAC